MGLCVIQKHKNNLYSNVANNSESGACSKRFVKGKKVSCKDFTSGLLNDLVNAYGFGDSALTYLHVTEHSKSSEKYDLIVLANPVPKKHIRTTRFPSTIENSFVISSN